MALSPVGTQTQVIGGKEYVMYSPEWYAAKDAYTVNQGKTAGAAAGTAEGQADKSKWETKYPGYQTPGPYSMDPRITQLMAAFGQSGSQSGTGVGSGGGVPAMPTLSIPGYTGTGSGAPKVAPIAPIDTTAQDAAVFNRAKDTVGETGSGSLASLRSALASRGMLGSGLEARGTAGVINEGQKQLGDTTREQAIKDVDVANQNANANYAGSISQRGQDISQMESGANREADLAKTAYTGAITGRAQDITNNYEQGQLALQQRQASLSALMAALSIGGGMKTAEY